MFYVSSALPDFRLQIVSPGNLVINCLANLHSLSTLVRFILSYFSGRVLPYKKLLYASYQYIVIHIGG